MTRPGFSLVELLVVTLILAVLVALLVPAARTSWDAALAARCQHNLAVLWQAQNSWRADRGTTLFTMTSAWPALLAPYVEYRGEVFRCPASVRNVVVPTVADSSGTSGGPGDGSDPGGSGGGGLIGPAGEPPAKGVTTADITFRIYARTAFAPYKPGQYLGTAFIDSSYGVKKQYLGDNKWYYGIDDRSFFSDGSASPSNLDYADMRFHLWIEDGTVTKMEILGSDEITGQRSWEVFRFEVWVRDEMLVDDFVASVGATVGIGLGPGTSSGIGSEPGTGGSGGGEISIPPFIAAFDYGLSKGTYEVEGVPVRAVDPKSILLLDYAKSVADYASRNCDDWSLYFIDDEEAWMELNAAELEEGQTWRDFVALRHSGQANVLFCDGHIERLGADQLHATSPLWRFGGQ